MITTFLIVFLVSLVALAWLGTVVHLFLLDEVWSMIAALVLACAGIALAITILSTTDPRETRVRIEYQTETTTTLG